MLRNTLGLSTQPWGMASAPNSFFLLAAKALGMPQLAAITSAPVAARPLRKPRRLRLATTMSS
ncbi:hypothetical protein D3C85_1831120 [compost metagenome]